MRRAIVHVGVEKTGSTSIQFTLGANRPALLAQGVLYPRAFGDRNQIKAYAYASETEPDEVKSIAGRTADTPAETFREAIREQLQREVEEHDPKLIVVSNEHCSSRLLRVTEVARLHKALAAVADRVQVLIYVRRQDECLRSAYSTYIKTGGTEGMRLPSAQSIAGKYDYFAIAQRWEEVFGRDNIMVRRFGRQYLKDGDVIADFLAATGIKPKGIEPVNEQNRSLGHHGLEALRLINRHLPAFVGHKFNPARGNIADLFESWPDDVKFAGDAELLAQFLESMRESNEKLHARYFSDLPRLFDDSSAQREPAPPSTTDDVARVFAHAWARKQEQVNRLRAARKG